MDFELADFLAAGFFLILFTVTLMCFIFVMFFFRNTLHKPLSSAALFFYSTLIFLSLRITWIFVKAAGLREADFTLNRVAFSFFLCSICVVFYTWMNGIFMYEGSTTKVFVAKIGLIIFNVVHLLVQISIISYLLSRTNIREQEGTALYDSSIFLTMISVLLLAFGFLIVGLRFFFVTSRTLLDSSFRRSQLIKIVGISMVFIVSMICKGSALMYRPIFHERFDQILFIFLTYIIPECLPSSFQVIIILLKAQELHKKEFANFSPLMDKISDVIEPLSSPHSLPETDYMSPNSDAPYHHFRLSAEEMNNPSGQ